MGPAKGCLIYISRKVLLTHIMENADLSPLQKRAKGLGGVAVDIASGILFGTMIDIRMLRKLATDR